MLRRGFLKAALGGAAVALGEMGLGRQKAEAASCTYAQKVCGSNRCRPSCVSLCSDPGYATCPQCAGTCPDPEPTPEPVVNCTTADAYCALGCDSAGCAKACLGDAATCAVCVACAA